MRIGILIYYILLLLYIGACFIRLKVTFLTIILNIPRVITLSIALFCKRDETAAKWNYVTFLIYVILLAPSYCQIIIMSMAYAYSECAVYDNECVDEALIIYVPASIGFVLVVLAFEIWITCVMKFYWDVM